jgi:hypothetical protein
VPDEDEDDDYDDISIDVVTAHRDSVLLQLGNQRCPSAAFQDNTTTSCTGQAPPGRRLCLCSLIETF